MASVWTSTPLAEEVGVPRRVDDVDLVPGPLDRGQGERHRTLPIYLLGFEIGDCVAVLDTSHTGGEAGEMDQGLGEGRLAATAVAHEHNVSDLIGAQRGSSLWSRVGETLVSGNGSHSVWYLAVRGGTVLDVRARKNVSRAVDPIARVVAKVGLSPTMITLSGATISIAGAVLISQGYLAVGCGVMAFGALLDVLDGVLARLTGRETIRGALLDSITDRIGEIAVWSGLAYYLATVPAPEPTLVMLTIIGICGSLMIPYVRAKAETFGVEGRGGWMGRAERLILFGAGVGLSEFWPILLEVTLGVLAALIWLTVAQRFYRTWKQLGA